MVVAHVAAGASSERNLTSGTVSYNGFTFPGPIGARIQAAPVYDTAERYVKYIKYTITVETVLTAEDILEVGSSYSIGTAERTDEIMNDARVSLQTAGGSLSFQTQGFGTLDVGTSAGSSQFDVSFGPHPRLLVWEPLGSNRAVRIAWICDVTIPECEVRLTGTNLYNIVSSFEYEIAWSIDEEGMTNRRITGVVESPNNWAGHVDGGSEERLYAISSIDLIREELLRIPTVDGFHRTHDVRLNKARTEMHFTIVDSEIPSDNAYFPGMIRIEARHKISSSLLGQGLGTAAGFRLWKGTLSASFTLAPGLHKFMSWFAFLIILNQRLKHTTMGDLVEYVDENGETKVRPAMTFYPLSLSLEEDIYSRTTKFDFTYMFESAPKKLLGAVGKSQLLEPVTTLSDAAIGGMFPEGSYGYTSEEGWHNWSDSLTDKVHHPRGYAKLGHLPVDDRRITLCNRSPGIEGVQNVYAAMPSTPAVDFLKPTCPDVDRSYLKYDNVIRITNETAAARIQKLKPPKKTAFLTPHQLRQGVNDSQNRLEIGGEVDVIVADDVDGVTQFAPVGYKGTIYLMMRGSAVRVGYEIPDPVLKSVGTTNVGHHSIGGQMYQAGTWSGEDVVAIPYKSQFETKKLVDTEDCPIWGAKWNKIYTLSLAGGNRKLNLKDLKGSFINGHAG